MNMAMKAPETIEEFADEIVAAAAMGMPADIFRAGVIVALMAYGELRHSEGFSDGTDAAAESHEMMAV